MHNLNDLLLHVINDAAATGFPVSNKLDRNVVIDKNVYNRVGACYRYALPEKYEVHLSELTQRANITDIKNILAHEVLHSHFLTMDHNYFWEMYKNRMNNMFGYNIKVAYSWKEIL